MSRKNPVGAIALRVAVGAVVVTLAGCATTAPGPDPYLARQLECIDAGRVGNWSEGQIDACRANVRAELASLDAGTTGLDGAR